MVSVFLVLFLSFPIQLSQLSQLLPTLFPFTLNSPRSSITRFSSFFKDFIKYWFVPVFWAKKSKIICFWFRSMFLSFRSWYYQTTVCESCHQALVSSTGSGSLIWRRTSWTRSRTRSEGFASFKNSSCSRIIWRSCRELLGKLFSL